MIEFITIFLGLVIGEQRIEVSVGKSVASVELRLDGEILGTIEGEPWQWVGDFGSELVPHELVAVARDANAHQLALARQWINLPSRRAEARLALDQGGGGKAVARLVWQALDFDEPSAIIVTFDGRPLEVDDPQRIELPRHDPRGLHFLRAEVIFSDAVQAQAELVFGGSYGEEVRSELTAILVHTDRKRLPQPEQIEGWFTKGGKPLKVAAVERGPVDVLVVRERSEELWEGLQDLLRQQRSKAFRGRTRRIGGQIETIDPGFEQGRVLLPWKFTLDDRLRFAFPRTEERQGQGFDVHLLPVSKNLVRFGGGSLFGILTEIYFAEDLQFTQELPLADAVAIAGLSAAAGDRRRAVLLLRSGVTEDSGRLNSSQVQEYLRQLQVPLVHWILNKKNPDEDGWGEGEQVQKLTRFKKALAQFHELLDHQAVIWLAGSHLPRDIELSPRAEGMRLLATSAEAFVEQVPGEGARR